MHDEVRNYFIEGVIADHDAYADYRQTKQCGLSVDLRLAMHACSSMLHLTDHVFHEFSTALKAQGINSLNEYLTHLDQSRPSYKIVRDCANAHMHRILTRHSPSISGADAIKEQVVITEYLDESGPYRIAEKEIEVALLDGTKHQLHQCLNDSLEMWWAELIWLGAMQSAPRQAQPQKPYPPPREVDGPSAALDMQVRRGVRCAESFQIRKFDYNTMHSEPVDLTGYQTKMTIPEQTDER